MSDEVRAPRKLRADGQRNRERLIAAAKASFSAVGAEVSLEEIAKRAEVGIGTLYRHFPTRDAIVEAVYRREVEQLAEAATELSNTGSAGEALHAWLRLCVDYIATKKVIVSAFGAPGGASELYAASGFRITTVMTGLVERALANGDIREDVTPDDLLRALVGFTYGVDAPDWRDSALRLIDVLMDGLRR